eukprot:Opistho-2@21289
MSPRAHCIYVCVLLVACIWVNAVDSSASAKADQTQSEKPSMDSTEECLGLPASSEDNNVNANVEIKVGETKVLDHMGPLVVDVDGSLKRIANWDSMTEAEREVAHRRLTARNKARLEKLRAAAEANDAKDAKDKEEL